MGLQYDVGLRVSSHGKPAILMKPGPWVCPPFGLLECDYWRMSRVQLTITRPDDWHLHLRDGEALAAVLPHTARQFARAIVMPNLKPPVTTVEQAAAYRDRILAALPAGLAFEPLMTLYLTDNTPPAEIARAAASGFVRLSSSTRPGDDQFRRRPDRHRQGLRHAGRDGARRPAAAGAWRSDRSGDRPFDRERCSSTPCWRR